MSPVPTAVYHVFYNANGGSGTVPVDARDYQSGDVVLLLGQGGLSRDGYQFLGWSLTSSGPVITSFNIFANTTVYAQWQLLGQAGVPTPPSTPPTSPLRNLIAALFGPNMPALDLCGFTIPLMSEPGEAAWALLNLILLVAGALLSLLMCALYFHRRVVVDDDSIEKDGKKPLREKHLLGRMLSLALVGVALILFVLTEDMSLKVVLIDQWTLPCVMICAAQIVLCAFSTRRKPIGNDPDDDKGTGEWLTSRTYKGVPTTS